jgi:hypothetical protein
LPEQIGVMMTGADHKLAGKVNGVRDGFDTIDHQIDDHLLQLHPITKHFEP